MNTQYEIKLDWRGEHGDGRQQLGPDGCACSRMKKDRAGCMFVYDVGRQVGWNGRLLEGQEQNAIG